MMKTCADPLLLLGGAVPANTHFCRLPKYSSAFRPRLRLWKEPPAGRAAPLPVAVYFERDHTYRFLGTLDALPPVLRVATFTQPRVPFSRVWEAASARARGQADAWKPFADTVFTPAQRDMLRTLIPEL